MDFSAPHSGFVIAAYVITFAVLAGLIISILLRAQSANAELRKLEERGARRRGKGAAEQRAL